MATTPSSPLAAALAEFNHAFGYSTPARPTANIPVEVRNLRTRLLEEECRELLDAIEEGDLAHIAKEAADLAYVLRGTTDAYGLDLDLAIIEVHESNMTKLGADGKPMRNEHGKTIKGPNYCEPDMTRTLAHPIPPYRPTSQPPAASDAQVAARTTPAPRKRDMTVTTILTATYCAVLITGLAASARARLRAAGQTLTGALRR